MINFKKIIKHALKYLLTVVLALVVLYLGAEAGFQIKIINEQWKVNRDFQKANKSIEEMFKADVDEGKTPEETFNLFVTALKNENVDLAVKYIVLDAERRQRYYDDFNEMKQKGKLKEYIESWPKWEDWSQTKDNYTDWESRAEVWYSATINESRIVYDPFLKKEIEITPGEYVQQDIIFIKNQNNIWKIESF